MTLNNLNQLMRISFSGITALSDAVIWKPDARNNTFILANIYGSESQVRGIFSAVVSHDIITVDDTVKLNRQYYESTMRYKSFRIGYGKYQALIRDDEVLKDCIIPTPEESVTDAWERFMKKRRIPIVRAWLPKLIPMLERQSLVERLEGNGLLSRGWYWSASDNAVCDLIVNEIYKAA